MKVCFVSPHRDGTGYSNASIEYMLSLDSVGVDIVARPIKMTNTSGTVPDKVKEFEQKDVRNVDSVVQFNLPSEFAYKGGIKNIGIFAYETNGFPNTVWAQTLDWMDNIIVCSNHEKWAIGNTYNRLLKKTSVVPYAVDISKFEKEYDLMDFDVPSNYVKFYTIAEYSRRKNIAGLMAAYYSTFSSDDNVLLVIKSSTSDRNPERATAVITDICNDLKRTMKKFAREDRYPRIALLTDYIPPDHLCSLHKTCDVFVNASHGETMCLPYLDALGFGNTTIVPKNTSFLDYGFDKELMVQSNESVVFGVANAPPGLYTADESWGNPSLTDLVAKMWHTYNNIEAYKNPEKAKQRLNFVIDNFDRKVVGNKFKEVLDAI